MEMDEHIAAYVRRFDEPEDEPLRAARARSEEADIASVPPEAGAMLRFLVRTVRARHVVEVGTGGGYSGLWLVGGMDPRGALTTIEIEPDNQALAQRAFTEAGVNDRVRSMLGAATVVLPKLADEHYELMFLDAAKSEYPEYLSHAKRLLRPGGLLVADNALWHGRVADPAATDADTEGVREFNDAIREDPTLSGRIVTVGDGLHVALYLPEESGPTAGARLV